MHRNPNDLFPEMADAITSNRLKNFLLNKTVFNDPDTALKETSKLMLQKFAESSNSERVNMLLLYLCFCSQSDVEDSLLNLHFKLLQKIRTQIQKWYGESDKFRCKFDVLKANHCISDVFDDT